METVMDTTLDKVITLKQITHFVEFLKEPFKVKGKLSAQNVSSEFRSIKEKYKGEAVGGIKGKYYIQEPNENEPEEQEAYERIEICLNLLIKIRLKKQQLTFRSAEGKKKLRSKFSKLKRKFHTNYKNEIDSYNQKHDISNANEIHTQKKDITRVEEIEIEKNILDKDGKRYSQKAIAIFYNIAGIDIKDIKEANSIIKKYGWNSGEKLYKNYRNFLNKDNRINLSPISKSGYNWLLKRYESVIGLCLNNKDLKNIAESELAEIIKNYENHF